MDVFIHAANILYVLSYSVRDMLWLRVLTVVAGATLMPYYYLQELWPPVIWGVVFIVINGWQIRRLLLERRPVEMTERERDLYQKAFRAFRPRDFLKLVEIGSWRDAEPKQTLVEKDRDLEEMMIIYTGNVAVEVDGKQVSDLGDGAFVGEMSFLTGKKPSANVTATKTTSYVTWPVQALRDFLGQNPELRASWQYLIGSDLAAKLRAA